MVIQNWHQVFKQKHPFWKYLSYLEPAKNCIDSETLIKSSSKEIWKQKRELKKIKYKLLAKLSLLFFFFLSLPKCLFSLEWKPSFCPHTLWHTQLQAGLHDLAAVQISLSFPTLSTRRIRRAGLSKDVCNSVGTECTSQVSVQYLNRKIIPVF